MSRISDRPTIRMPTREEDKVITAAAKNDPNAPPPYIKATEGYGSLESSVWSAKIREQKIARFCALQPRGCCLLQIHWRRLAVTNEQCAP